MIFSIIILISTPRHPHAHPQTLHLPHTKLNPLNHSLDNFHSRWVFRNNGDFLQALYDLNLDSIEMLFNCSIVAINLQTDSFDPIQLKCSVIPCLFLSQARTELLKQAEKNSL